MSIYRYIHTYIYDIYIHVSIYIIYSGESEYREGSGTLRRLAPLYLAPYTLYTCVHVYISRYIQI